jgi:hypothetical protein
MKIPQCGEEAGGGLPLAFSLWPFAFGFLQLAFWLLAVANGCWLEDRSRSAERTKQ